MEEDSQIPATIEKNASQIEELKNKEADLDKNTSKEMEGEGVKDEHEEDKAEMEEHIEGEHIEGEHIEGEHIEGEHIEGEHIEGEHIEGEHIEAEGVMGEGDELAGEEQIEQEEGEKTVEDPKLQLDNEVIEEEEGLIEEPPPDPTAPYDFSESKEALIEPFELRPDQLAEVEQLWEYFQNYTPVYTDIDNYITEKELIYMLKSLNLMPVTPEQLQELIAWCVKPRHHEGHISFDQFVKIVTIRQRSVEREDELRCALQVFDPEKKGSVDREELKELLATKGHKMPQKTIDRLIKEVDISNDGTIGVEDVVGTLCIDLNPEDIEILRGILYPETARAKSQDNF